MAHLGVSFGVFLSLFLFPALLPTPATAECNGGAPNGVFEPADDCIGSGDPYACCTGLGTGTDCDSECDTGGSANPDDCCSDQNGGPGACKLVLAGTTCRTATGPCDPAETCTGANDSCPADSLADSTTVCRAASGDCDLAERCSGVAAFCPANSLAPLGADCGDGTFCNGAELCNGVGVCEQATSLPCDDGQDCTNDFCNESTDSCDIIPDDAYCDDNDVCTEDTCDPIMGCESIPDPTPPLSCIDAGERLCEAEKTIAAAKYSSCVAKARKKYLISGDTVKETESLSKCEEKISSNWVKIEAKGGCTVLGDQSNVQSIVQECSSATQDVIEVAAPPPSFCEPHDYDVLFMLDSSQAPLSTLQFSVHYSGAPGEFAGTGSSVSCEDYVASAVSGFHDYDGTSELVVGLIDAGGTFDGPDLLLARCRFLGTTVIPAESDFTIEVTQADDENLLPTTANVSVAFIALAP